MSTEKMTDKIPDEEVLEQISYDGPVKYVSSSELLPFSGKIKAECDDEQDVNVSNPFDVPDDNDPDMRELRKGIEEYGVLFPLLVRRREDGKYELLSGYRRQKAVDSINEERRKKSEEEMKLPIIEIPDCNDDRAIEILTTSNMHRKKITLREQIKACGLTYRAKRHQGKASEKSAADIVGEMFNVKAKTVQRYSALLNLNDGLLRLIGGENDSRTHYRNNEGKLKLSRRAGELLSTLNKSQQEIVLQFLQDDNNSIPIPLASWIRKKFNNNPDLTLDELKKVVEDWKRSNMSGSVSEPENKGEKISFDTLRKYFPDQTEHEIIAKVHSFFRKWQEAGSPEGFEIRAL